MMDHHRLGYGYPPSEGMAFGLSGALSFLYARSPVGSLPFYLIGRAQTLEANFCENLGLPLTVAATDDPAEAWHWIDREVGHGRPLLIWTSVRDLDYQQVRLDNAQHAVIVVGYDLKHDYVVLADHEFPDLQRCSLDAFARARSSTAAFPGPTRHTTFLIDFFLDVPAQLPSAAVVTARSVACAIDQMLAHPSRGPGYRGGIEALQRFGEDYRAWPEWHGEELRRTLKLLYVLIERAGTGGSLFRSLWAGFLEEMAWAMSDFHLLRAAEIYRGVADLWKALADVVRATDCAAAHRAGEGLLTRIVAEESHGLEALVAWQDGHRHLEAPYA